MFGFAIAGCGNISRAHIESIKEIPGAALRAVWSQTFERAAQVAAREGCDAARTLEELCHRDDVDAVIICTPSGFHLEPALAAIQAGKHVLIEKPLEVTEERCRAIIDAAEQYGVKVGVVFQSRFAPANQAVYEAANSGKFGRLVMGNAYVKWFRDQTYYDSGAWRGTWQLDGGGALMNQAIHTVDLLLWTMGPVESVAAHSALLAHDRIEVEDTLVATLKFQSGALGSIEATTSIWPGYPKKIEIHGDQGGAILADDAVVAWYQGGATEPDEEVLKQLGPKGSTGTSREPMAMSFELHRRQIENFISAVRHGTPLAINGQQGLLSVQLVRAIYHSAQTGEVVKLGEQR